MNAPKRILVVEDNPMFGSILRFILRSQYAVTLMPDGRRGLQALQAGGYDLMITDWQMPVMAGLELCTFVRANSEFKLLPILVVTAKVFEIEVERLEKEFEPCEFFFKPFDAKELVAAVDRLLNPSRHVAVCNL